MGTVSPRLYRFDASGCNGCDVELVEMTALVPLAELGVELVETPKAANVLVVTGGANLKTKGELEATYGDLQEPRVVVAVGSCAATMGIFKGGYAMTGPIDAIIPVHWYILGCPPRPQAILNALAEAFQLEREGLGALLETPPGFRGDPHVDQSKCMGCGACAHVCPAEAIEIVEESGQRVIRFKRRDCIFCATCQDVCPSQAVELAQREKAWFSDKEVSRSEARLPLVRCLACGAPYVPAEQVAWAMRKLDETLRMDDAVRARVGRSASICPTCRRNSFEQIREAKRILAALAKEP